MVPARTAAQDYTFTTFAGTPTRAGSQNGQNGDLSAPAFTFPFGIGIAADGALYVTDTGNSLIRKVTASGTVTTFVGSFAKFGSSNGTTSDPKATFNRPQGPVFDSSGNLYVADFAGATIRKITPSGTVTTVAGSASVAGNTDGTGEAARFNAPSSLAIDSANNLYVADSGNHVIRKITPAGVVTTIAGTAGSAGTLDGQGAAARFNNPRGLVSAADGTLYVADSGNNTIRKIATDGTVSTLAGTVNTSGTADGTGAAARFNFPNALAFDPAGNLIVADVNNHAIRRVTTAGVVTTVAGLAGTSGRVDGNGATARFYQPTDIAVAADGVIYVADYWNQLIRKIATDGTVSTLAGSGGLTGYYDGSGYVLNPILLRNPTAAAVDAAGNVYVSDTLNHSIRKISPSGVTSLFAGDGVNPGSANATGTAARFNSPAGLAVDAAGNVYVADSGNHLVRKITAAGEVTTLAGVAGESGHADGSGDTVRFDYPSGLAVDGAGNVYVADYANHVIRVITPGGSVSTLAGKVGESGTADGQGGAARFNYPRDIALDGSGLLYVADTGNSNIRRVSTAGLVSTLAGGNGAAGAADGTGSAARFENPVGLAADAAGNVYVADSGNSTLRKISPAGTVTTIGGSPGSIGNTDGVGTAARFNHPTDIAVDASGNLYVVDNRNHTIRKGTLPGNNNGGGNNGGGNNGGGNNGGGNNGGGNGNGGGSGSGGAGSGNGGVVDDGNTGTGVLLQPVGMVADGLGYIYIVDTANHCIRRIDSSNVATVFAGQSGSAGSTDGKGTAARFSSPTSIARDSSNFLYVADAGNLTIRKIASDGTVTTFAGKAGESGTTDGKGDAARFGLPYGIAYGSNTGDLYVTDAVNATIRRITSDGTVTTFAGSNRVTGDADGIGSAARFNNPTGVVYDGTGYLAVADTYNNTLRAVSTARRVISTRATGTIVTAGTAKVVLTDPGLPGGSLSLDVAVAAGDNSAAWATKVTSVLNANTTVTARYSASNDLDYIYLTYAVSVDDSQPVNISLDNGTSVGITPAPTSTASDPAGTVSTFAGSAGISGAYDGPGEYALFNLPYGLALDSTTGSIFIADTGNNCIRRMNNRGLVTTVAGIAGISGKRSGDASVSLFNQPKGVAVFSSGLVHVTDTGNSILRVIGLSAEGNFVTTLPLTAPSTGGNNGGGSGGGNNGGGSSGGGGGGSPSLVFLAVVGSLAGARLLSRKRAA